MAYPAAQLPGILRFVRGDLKLEVSTKKEPWERMFPRLFLLLIYPDVTSSFFKSTQEK